MFVLKLNRIINPLEREGSICVPIINLICNCCCKLKIPNASR